MKAKRLLSNCWFTLKITWQLNRRLFYVWLPLMLVNAAVPFIPIVFLRLLLNEITLGKDSRRIISLVFLMASAVLLGNILQRVLESQSEVQTEITLKKVKNDLGEKIMKMSFAQVEQPRVRDFIQLAKEGNNFSDILNCIADITTGLLTIVGLVSIIVTVQPLIFLLVLVTAVVRMLADRQNLKLWDKWRPKYAPIMRKISYFVTLMKNTVYGKEIRLNGLEDWITKKDLELEETYLQACTRHNMEIQRNSAFAEFAAILQEAIVYLILAYRVVFTGMPIGDFSMYMTSIKTFSTNVQKVFSAFSQMLKNGLFAEDLRYCNESATTTKEEHLQETHLAEPFVLEFRHVSFCYPNTERMVLKDISLTLRSGESLSLVGMNGAGKTTFVKLLCRLYAPTSGQILLNGMDISSISPETYAQKLGVVFQDFKLFAFSMEENITLGASPNEASLKTCIRQSGLTQKLESLPDGIKTNISKEFDESGVEFSGGEGQKLAMARVLYKNAPIIILDEPTSALDPLAEYEVYSRFHQLIQGKCAVYISHRLSSTRFTDKIAFFYQGQLVEYGSHDQLMAIPDGKYAALFKLQSQYYVADGGIR